MERSAKITSLTLATLQPIPFCVLAIYIVKSRREIPDLVKVMCAIGFVFGFAVAGLDYMIAFPHSFTSSWSIIVLWLTLTLNGIEHWLFALQYHYSSIEISKKLSLQPVVYQVPTHKSTLFLACSFIYALAQICFCVL